ncbi:MAG TPA: dienelactone hydrolase family protein [Polyangiaceae bacterium]|jgi:carboxymethylenebutenolidase
MWRFFLLGAFALACGSSAPQPVVPARDAGAFVDLAGGGRGYFVAAKGEGKHPALVVVHEWWGLNAWAKQQAERFAARGYDALAVDLYRGHVARDVGEAHELTRGLPEDRALADLQAGFAWLAARPDVDPARIGAIGWCMGGGYALALAVAEPKLRAVVVNYGRLVTSDEKIGAIHAAFLGNFAGADRGIMPADVRAFEAKLKEKNPDVDIKIYDGAGHAFMNPDNKAGYDEAAAKDAWTRIDAFLARTLSVTRSSRSRRARAHPTMTSAAPEMFRIRCAPSTSKRPARSSLERARASRATRSTARGASVRVGCIITGSIEHPQADVTDGYEPVMPPYTLRAEQKKALVADVRSLR